MNGVPFGPFALYEDSATLRQPVFPFTGTVSPVEPPGIVMQLELARDSGVKIVTQMTGKRHSAYLTNGRFDYNKWKAAMDSFNTGAIKTAVGEAVSNGTILFNSLMDEPNHREGDPPVADWGGVMTHALLDSMSRYVKAIFPTLKTGVVVTWTWQKDRKYQDVDVMLAQYWVPSKQTAQAYRDSAVASAQRQNVGLMLSLNVLHGGALSSGTPMTAAQVQGFGDTLLAAGFSCGLAMWRWDTVYMSDPANRAAFMHVANTAAARPTKICGK
jgi:hypothetical protein